MLFVRVFSPQEKESEYRTFENARIKDPDKWDLTCIDEKGFPENAYYPLMEIVTIRLAEFLWPGLVIDKLKDLEKLNIRNIKKEKNYMVFYLLPDAKLMDPRELAAKYATLSRIMKAV
ncbi:MAG: hypothetical protein ABH883_04415 [Candidatus Omnitrophota bacterium]